MRYMYPNVCIFEQQDSGQLVQLHLATYISLVIHGYLACLHSCLNNEASFLPMYYIIDYAWFHVKYRVVSKGAVSIRVHIDLSSHFSLWFEVITIGYPKVY